MFAYSFACKLKDAWGTACGAVVIASKRVGHEVTCMHLPVGCPHSGCDVMVARKELGAHWASCLARIVLCTKCGEVRGGQRVGVALCVYLM
jgi:hypothetical protein